MARYIPPPREDFIDPRTNKISISWFKYLLKEVGNVDDVQLQAAMNAVYGVAAAAQAEQRADEAVLLASIPVQAHDFSPQIDEAKLMSLRESPQDFMPEIDAVRLSRTHVDTGEIEKRIDNLERQFSIVRAPSVSDHADLTGLADNDHPQYLLVADIDDTPVNGEVAQPISSNWAFDHVAAADPHTGYRLESADHSHQSTGAQAGQLDHGLALTGLTDDDHTQYLLAAGTRSLSADWDAGSFEIRAQTFESDVVTGTAPLVIASTTKVTNLNADLLDDQSGAYYLDSANFTGVNWTDLTDAGATTLHKHDHGGMDGLTDDDHGHYWNYARGAARVSLRI